jgi:polyphosphate kinase
MPGVSENIRVRSIVDRFLEHSRIMVFGDAGKEHVYFSSADWMPRNFERRVEVMFPIEAPELKRRVCEEIIPTYLRDNCRARVLMPDGAYVRAAAWHDEPEHRAQRELLPAIGGASKMAAPGALATSAEADGASKSKHSAAKAK